MGNTGNGQYKMQNGEKSIKNKFKEDLNKENLEQMRNL